jgi:hypothetical protein
MDVLTKRTESLTCGVEESLKSGADWPRNTPAAQVSSPNSEPAETSGSGCNGQDRVPALVPIVASEFDGVTEGSVQLQNLCVVHVFRAFVNLTLLSLGLL